MQKTKLWTMVMLVSLMVALAWACSAAPEAPRIDKDTVKGWLGNPQVVILDVRAAMIGRTARPRLKAPSVKIPRRCKPGLPVSPRRKKSSCTAPERTKAPAPVWRRTC